MNECPLCGEERGWHYCYCDPEAPSPEEGWCDFCGFWYQQGTISAHDDMLRELDSYMWGLEAQIENIEEDIKEVMAFKEKIPQLRVRIDFDALRVKLGYERTKGGGWTKKGSNIERM